MPYKQCSRPGCGNLTPSHVSRCEEHQDAEHTPIIAKHTDKVRGRATASQRGYGSRWRRVRKLHIDRHPLCVHCGALGITKVAEEVDHIIRHSGPHDPLLWDMSNLQSLCKSCHSRKTRKEQYKYN